VRVDPATTEGTATKDVVAVAMRERDVHVLEIPVAQERRDRRAVLGGHAGVDHECRIPGN
jgi:hypothetical protein